MASGPVVGATTAKTWSAAAAGAAARRTVPRRLARTIVFMLDPWIATALVVRNAAGASKGNVAARPPHDRLRGQAMRKSTCRGVTFFFIFAMYLLG
jgi:hypothetical protein